MKKTVFTLMAPTEDHQSIKAMMRDETMYHLEVVDKLEIEGAVMKLGEPILVLKKTSASEERDQKIQAAKERAAQDV